jgi:GINS complex subunit 2
MWRCNNSINELEFLAENIIIEIIPNFKKDELNLLCGKFGPFKPNRPTKVPLWLALQYKKNRKCRIVPPGWLEFEILANKVEQEKNNENNLQELTFYFFEILLLLFNK